MSVLPIKRDFLTNCYAREGLEVIMKTMVEEYKAHGKSFSFFLIDIDHFKKYNDRYGHIHGDEALKYFSSTLRLYLEENECYPFRLGGDEFVVIFPRTTSQEAANLGKKLEKALKKRPFIYKDKQMRVISFSGGIATYPADGQTLEELLENSDRAMYFSKKRGRSRTTQYHSLPAYKIIRSLIFAGIGILVALSLLFLGTAITKKHYLQDSWNKTRSTVAAFKNRLLEKIMSIDIGSFKLPNIQLPSIPSQTGSLIPELPPAPEETAVAPIPEKKEPRIDIFSPLTTIYLKNGGIVKGVTVSEDDQEIRLKFQSEYGEGSTKIQKSLIEKIERP